jgi:hypothetical protein
MLSLPVPSQIDLFVCIYAQLEEDVGNGLSLRLE